MSTELPALDWVLEKTPKGRDELTTRAHHLHPGQRNLLILADGRRPVAELVRAGPDAQRCLQVLAELIAEGFLQRAGSAPLAAAPTAAPGAPAVASAGTGAHAMLVALVQEMFPAQAAKLMQKIAPFPDTPEGHRAAVDACVRFARLVIDHRQVDEFARRALALREGG